MKIAIVQLGRIGDLVLVTSAIKQIKQKYPNSKIYFIAGSANCFILENNPDIEQILIFDKNPLKLISFLIKLKSIKFDYYIDPKDHFSTESRIIARIANVKTKIGFNGENNKNKKIFDIGIASNFENQHLHFVERIKNTLEPLGISTVGMPLPYIFIDEISQKVADDFLHSNDISKFILINISASNINKMWLPEKWIELINLLKSDNAQNVRKIVILSDALHFDTVEKICSETNIILFPPSKLMIASALISRADLLISPDTSLIHIASAFDIPVIALTANDRKNIIKFYPLSSKKEVVLAKNENDIVGKVEVNDVWEAYKKF